MKILQVNTTVNTGSTGRITEEIGQLALQKGHKSFIAAGRTSAHSKSQVIKIGSSMHSAIQVLHTRLTDRHGFGPSASTKRLIESIEKINPDIISLHNLHGYYLNIEAFFDYLKKKKKPVTWTLHDCWPFTGHCTYFDSANCYKWKTGCYECPKTKAYPSSLFVDNSEKNYQTKKDLFKNMSRLVIITPSQWLKSQVDQSFLNGYNTVVINNGVDIDVFRPLGNTLSLGDKKIVLGVASIWDQRKGLDDFIRLSTIFGDKYLIVLIGLNKDQIKGLPKNILGIERTENVSQLAAYYSAADVFVNPTSQDNFPTTNLEALACGTPVITYNTGGSPEAIDHSTGIVIEKGDVERLKTAIENILLQDKRSIYTENCRNRAVERYNKIDRFNDYLNLFETLMA